MKDRRTDYDALERPREHHAGLRPPRLPRHLREHRGVTDASYLLEYFDRPISFHRVLVGVADSVVAALLLSQAIYWQRVVDRKGEPYGWFYKTAAEWLGETGMGREEFQTARRKLVEAGVLEYELRGMPATGHYRVNVDALSLRLSSKQDCGIPANCIAGNQQTSTLGSRKLPYIGTESTSESTASIAPSALLLEAAGPINGNAVAYIPLIGGAEYAVSKQLLTELEAAYPAVDGPETMREIRVWCLTNPTKRKTARGAPRFINRWFERVQNGA